MEYLRALYYVLFKPNKLNNRLKAIEDQLEEINKVVKVRK